MHRGASFLLCLMPAMPFFTAPACAAGITAGAEHFIEFRDSAKPGTDEVASGRYAMHPWTENEKAIALAGFRRIHALAPGLLPRGAAGGKIAVYRAKLRTYAKGGFRRMVLDRKMFFHPDRTFTILLHETVHTADSMMKLSGSPAFRAIFEPRILKARTLLRNEGLTPATAAALPIGPKRQRIEQLVRRTTGLPSAYAARNLAECLAEVVSFWLSLGLHYTPPPRAQSLLRPFVRSAPAEPDKDAILLHAARALYRQGDYDKAIKTLTQIIRHDPTVYQAWSARGYAFLKLRQRILAERDIKQARDRVPKLQSGYAFYDAEWNRIHKATSP